MKKYAVMTVLVLVTVYYIIQGTGVGQLALEG